MQRLRLVSLFFAVCGCSAGDDPPTVEERVASVFERLPAADAKATDVLSPLSGPDGALFGLRLSDGNQAYVMGDVGPDGTPTISGVVLADASGQLILRQDFAETWQLFTVPSGDAIRIEVAGAVYRFTTTLAATRPPTEIVVTVPEGGSEGELVVEESLLGVIAHDAYAGGAGTERVAAASNSVRSALFWPSADGADSWCAKMGDGVVAALGLLCDGASIGTEVLAKRVPQAVIEIAKIATTRGLDALSERSGKASPTGKTLTGLKYGVNFSAEFAKQAVGKAGDVAQVARKVNAFGAACFTLGAADDLSSATDKSLASRLCGMLESGVEQDPGTQFVFCRAKSPEVRYGCLHYGGPPHLPGTGFIELRELCKAQGYYEVVQIWDTRKLERPAGGFTDGGVADPQGACEQECQRYADAYRAQCDTPPAGGEGAWFMCVTLDNGVGTYACFEHTGTAAGLAQMSARDRKDLCALRGYGDFYKEYLPNTGSIGADAGDFCVNRCGAIAEGYSFEEMGIHTCNVPEKP